MADKPTVEIRTATTLDLPQIQNIFNHYVTTSAATFQIQPLGPASFAQKLEEAQKLDLPYLVATIPQHDEDPHRAEGARTQKTEKVVSYTSTSGFQNFLEGYKHRAELALFPHPDFPSQGIGSRLLAALLAARPQVKEVIACVAIDAESRDGRRGCGSGMRRGASGRWAGCSV